MPHVLHFPTPAAAEPPPALRPAQLADYRSHPFMRGWLYAIAQEALDHRFRDKLTFWAFNQARPDDVIHAADLDCRAHLWVQEIGGYIARHERRLAAATRKPAIPDGRQCDMFG